jgi:cellulose synthase/poly-beta-1,6-N-acetylglucosamine synthase-like glycosyltransferase
MIPTYREPPEVLEVMLDHLAEQDFPRERITVVLAFEQRDADARPRAARLVEQFRGTFANLWVTFHPDREGEVRGKASNLAYASRWAKRRLVDEFGVDITTVLVTVCDADSRLHHKYLSALTYKFVSDPDRRYRIWQPALMFYSNIWRIPLVARLSAGLYSVWQLSRLVARYKLVTQSTYSLSLATCDRVGYWDVDVIPEDSRMFFKVFFALGHEAEVRVEPIFLPVLADAAEGPTLWSTLANHYRQTRRWAWGVSDIPYVVQRAIRQSAVPLWARLRRVGFYAEEHVVWPTHWFLLVVGGGLIAYLSPEAANRVALEDVRWLSGWLITACLPSLGVVIWLDHRLRPERLQPADWWDGTLGLLAWLLLPLVGLVLTTLPALDAHTRLLFGRYLHYQVTEKLPADRGQAPRWRPDASSAEAA